MRSPNRNRRGVSGAKCERYKANCNCSCDNVRFHSLSPGSFLTLLVDHLFADCMSIGAVRDGGTGSGDVPSPIRTITPGSVCDVLSVTALTAPANIRLARAAMIVLFNMSFS